MKIELYSNHQKSGDFAEVDDADGAAVVAFRWSVFKPRGSRTLYARTSVSGKTVYLHRLITAAQGGDEIDHIDGDGLNNVRANLRFVTHQENLRSAARLPGRFGNPTTDELDAELEAFEASFSNVTRTELGKTTVKTPDDEGA